MSSRSGSSSGGELSSTDDEDEDLPQSSSSSFQRISSESSSKAGINSAGYNLGARYKSEPHLRLDTPMLPMRSKSMPSLQTGSPGPDPRNYRAQSMSVLPQFSEPGIMTLAVFEKLLSSDRVKVIDVRDMDFFYMGRIPGARHVPNDTFAAELMPLVHEFAMREISIVFCCTHGTLRARRCANIFSRAADAMSTGGRKCAVFRLQGGIAAWSKHCQDNGIPGMETASFLEVLSACDKASDEGDSPHRKAKEISESVPKLKRHVTFGSCEVSRFQACPPAGPAPDTLPWRRVVKAQQGKVPRADSGTATNPPVRAKTLSCLPPLDSEERQSPETNVVVRSISPEGLDELLGLGKARVIDVRDLDFFLGHIPGARHHPDDSFEEELPGLLHDLTASKQCIVFHCMNCQHRGPRCARMFVSMAQAQQKGASLLPSVFFLEGGFQAWQQYCRTKDVPFGIAKASLTDALLSTDLKTR